MLRSTILTLSLAFAASAPAASAEKAATEPAERFCATLTGDETNFVVDTRLHVLEQTNRPGPFRYADRKGAPLRAIMCRRAGALPLVNDHKVVDAGYPFYIQTVRSITILDKHNGNYRLQLHKGQMTQAERQQMNERLRQLTLASRKAGGAAKR